MIVTTRHMLTVPGFTTRGGFCRGKSKQWAKRNGLDWSDFVRNGIEDTKLEAVGDAFALALVKWARECAAREVANG